MAKPRDDVDREMVKADYAAGLMPLREIAAQHNISHTIIRKWAVAEGWSRNLQARIQARAEELVSRQAVSADVSKGHLETERMVIEANALRIAQVRGDHRGNITRARNLLLSMLEELEGATDHPDLFSKLEDILAADPDSEDTIKACRDAYRKALSLGGRIKAIKELVEALKGLVALERQAYNLDNTPEDKPPERIMDPMELARDIAFALARGLH